MVCIFAGVMASKKEEIAYYSMVYIFAFGKDRSFFHNMDAPAICAFLTENYWGDNLMFKTKLLAKLLYFESFSAPAATKKGLIGKSQALDLYLTQNQG
jgi:hypothetical protein